jgi:hypothetical protein
MGSKSGHSVDKAHQGYTEREQENEGGKNGDHAHNGMAVAQKSPAFLGLSEF